MGHFEIWLRKSIQCPQLSFNNRDSRKREYDGALPLDLTKKEQRRQWCLFDNNIICNFMVYQERFETKLLQLFAHPESSEWFSIIPIIIFELTSILKWICLKCQTFFCPLAAGPASMSFNPFLWFFLDRTIWNKSRHYQFGWVCPAHLEHKSGIEECEVSGMWNT